MEILVDKDAIPYRFDMDLGGDLFTFELNYNATFDFFTMDIEKDGQVIVAGDKLIINQPLFVSFTDERLPKWEIMPVGDGEIESRVTWANINETVILTVGEIADE